MSSLPDHCLFECDGFKELYLSSGATSPVQILLVPPLFDEMNRIRRSLVQVMLKLEEHNIGAILPDLPGTNESMQPQHAMDLDKWASALHSFSQQAENPTHVASFRGGSLVDHKIELPHWRLSPVKGRSLLRTMMRTRIAADKESGLSTSMGDLMETARRDIFNLAGNLLNPEMIKQLDSAQPFEFPDTRTVRLESEAKEADAIMSGGPFWLRAEPSDDMDLVTSISNDLINWVNG